VGLLALGSLVHFRAASSVQARTADALHADAPAAITAQQLKVLGALASAIVLAAGGPGSRARAEVVSQQLPQAIAQGAAAHEPIWPAGSSELLDAIDRAPSPGPFASLTGAQRQAFIREALGPLAPLAAGKTEIAAMQRYRKAAERSYLAYAARVQAGALPWRIGTASGPEAPDPPQRPARSFALAGAPAAGTVLARTVLAGLELVCAPLTPLSPATALTPLSPATALIPLTSLAPPLPTHGKSATDLLPAPMLGDALAVWILGT